MAIAVVCAALLASASVIAALLSRPASFELVPFGSMAHNDHVYLFVGADSGIERPVGDVQYSATGAARADVLLLVRVSPDGGVSVVSIPRDIIVMHGEKPKRITLTLLDGPGAVVEAVCVGFGVSVDRYVQIDTKGFTDAIDAIGGIEVELPYPLRDPGAGLNLPEGVRTVDGAEALSLVRSRHVEAYRDGAWVAMNEHDGALERARVSGVLFHAITTKLAEQHPVELLKAAWSVSDDLTIGGGIHPDEILTLIRGAAEPRVLPVEDFGAKWSVRLGDGGDTMLKEAGFNTSCAR